MPGFAGLPPEDTSRTYRLPGFARLSSEDRNMQAWLCVGRTSESGKASVRVHSTLFGLAKKESSPAMPLGSDVERDRNVTRTACLA